VNGVPAAFQVEPGWGNEATVTPQHAITQEERAHAVLEVETTEVVHVMARVENITEAVALTVSTSGHIGDTSTE